MENDLVVIKIHEDDRKRFKVLGAEWGSTLPDTVQIVFNEWEEAQEATKRRDYVVEKNKDDLKELLDTPNDTPKYICSECGRNYLEDKSEPYCPHARFTGNAYYLSNGYLIRDATQSEIIEYKNKVWEEKYGR